MSAHTTQDTPLRCLIASGVNITRLPAPASGEYPTKDFAVLQGALDAATIDSENYLELGGPWVKMMDRAMGPKWGVAAAAVVHARALGVQAIFAMGDDVGLPLGILLQLTRTRLPFVLTGQHMMSRLPQFFLGKLHMHDSFSRILCLADEQYRYLRDHYRLRPERLATIYWYADHRYFRPMPDIPVRHQVCSAGMTYRDYKTLIEATRGLDVDVKIEAHSAWFNNGVNFTPDMLHDRFEVCSYGTTAALRQLYAESSIVTVPLLDVPVVGGYSTLLEGMAMGKPVIASRIKFIGDFIKDGWNGFLVRPGDAEQLRDRINFLLANPAEARRIGENARKTIEEHFTLDHYRDRVVNTLKQVVSERPTLSSRQHPVGA